MKVKITDATVIWGSGIEPKGAVPPARFEARVHLIGAKRSVNPVFRVWRVKIGQFPGLEKRGAKFPALGKNLPLGSQVTAGPAGTWVIQGIWPEAPETGDRLVVEVRRGTRRLGWASSEVTEQLLQVIEKRPGVIVDELKKE
ncbi:MAG: hypothetical protein Q8O00_01405 [Holophaga sp.]|nr:hypothetical protein [Holophaga sp.]